MAVKMGTATKFSDLLQIRQTTNSCCQEFSEKGFNTETPKFNESTSMKWLDAQHFLSLI